MFLPKPLNIKDTENTAPINKFAREVVISLEETHAELSRQNASATKTAATVATTAASGALPSDVTSASGSSAPVTIDGQVYCQVTVNYTAPTPLGTFAGVFLAISGYNGSSKSVKVAEDNFTGVAGGSQSFTVILNRTSEIITCYLVAKNNQETASADWQAAPSFTLTLNGSVTAPATPSGLSVVARPLSNTLTWSGNTEGNMKAYTVYRNTVNTFSSATKIGTVPWVNNGSPSYIDNTATIASAYFYWVTATNNANLESAQSTSVTATTAAASLDTDVADGSTYARPLASRISSGKPLIDFSESIHLNKTVDNVPDGITRYAATPSTLTYRPTSNPLTATDAGSNATISIASFTLRTSAKGDISVSSGSVTALSYGTLYYVYYDDSNLAGGAVTYAVTSTKENAINGQGRIFIGSIITPAATGPNTTGNNDGGAGAQGGQTAIFLFGSSAISGSLLNATSTNLQNAIDGSFTTFGKVNTNTTSGAANAVWILSAASPTSAPWQSLTLFIRSKCPTNGTGSTATINYSKDGGASFTTIRTATASTWAIVTDSVSLPVNQNVALVQVEGTLGRLSGTGAGELDIYEAWIVGIQ